jgi:hypothetical protein
MFPLLYLYYFSRDVYLCDLQGGAVNRELFLTVPLPSPLEVVSGKISSGLSYSVNKAEGTGGPTATMEIACRTETPLRALRRIEKYEDLRRLSNSKNMVFNVKKLLKVGVGLML